MKIIIPIQVVNGRAILQSPEIWGKEGDLFYSNSITLNNMEDQGRLSWGSDCGIKMWKMKN